jgi:hypothetical protein
MATFTGVPIHNALKTGEDRFAKGWIETIIAGVPFFKMSSVLPIDGRTYNQEHEYVLPDVQFRDLNEYPADTYGDTVDSTWGTAIIHSRIKIDRAALRSGMSNPAKLIARRYREHAKAAAMRVNWESINGTGASKGFKGLKQLVTDGWGTISNDGSGTGNFSFDNLDEAFLNLEHGPPNLLLMNKYVELEVTKKARSHTSFPLIDVGTDALGQPVTRYKGVPIETLRVGRTATANTNADILPQTETTGGGTVESSIYLIRFGEDAVTTLLGNNSSMEMQSLGESTEGPYLVGQLEFYPGLASFDPHSLHRYAGITLS